MPSPVVSIITPTFNRGHLLARVWQSLTSQRPEFEWIVVDDGSTDDTAHIVNSFADSRIVLITLPANQGVNCARNAGVRRARGQYVVFLDSDDELSAAALETATAALASAPPQVGAILTRAELYPSLHPITPIKHGALLDECAVVCRGALRGDHGVMYKRDVFSFQMLPDDLRGCEQVFVYGITRRYAYLCLDIPFSIVHRQSDNLSAAASVIQRSSDIARSYERILANHSAILTDHPSAVITYAQKALYRYLIARDLTAAWRVYRRGLRSSTQCFQKARLFLTGLAGLIGLCGAEYARLRYRNWTLARSTR